MKTKIATLILLVSLTPLLAFTQTLKPDLLNWIHKGINEFTKSIKVETKTISGTKVDGWDATKTKVDDAVDATQYFISKDDSSSNKNGWTTRNDFKNEYNGDPLTNKLKKSGSVVKKYPFWGDNYNTGTLMGDGYIKGCLIYVEDTTVITGIAYGIQVISSAAVTDNFNGVILFKYNATTFDQVAVSANVPTAWTGARGFYQIPFTAQYTALPGFYMACGLANYSSVTTAGTITNSIDGNGAFQNALVGKLCSFVNAGNSTAPASLTISSMTIVDYVPAFMLY